MLIFFWERVGSVTKEELCKKYHIPKAVLNLYEKTNTQNGAAAQWDDRDLEKISILMTLCESGFSESEAVLYLQHLEDHQEYDACMALLDTKRHSVLDEINRREKQIENIDYLKYKIRNGGTNNE